MSQDEAPKILRIDQGCLLSPSLVRQIYEDESRDYYASTDWSPEFYVLQARIGFIAVGHEFPDGTQILLPELQKSYCVFDWESIDGNRSLLKEIRKRLNSYRIRINHNPERVLHAILDYHGNKTWLCSKYIELCHQLFARPPMGLFRMCSVELYNTDGRLIAGELGYVLGATFTSLTGFCQRESRISLGKMQILCLTKLLARTGFKFLNLGQPPRDGQMQYKSDLGGIEINRHDFLSRWNDAISVVPIGIDSFLTCDVPLGDLFHP